MRYCLTGDVTDFVFETLAGLDRTPRVGSDLGLRVSMVVAMLVLCC